MLRRRDLLWGGVALCGAAGVRADAPGEASAFDAESLAGALRGYGIASMPSASPALVLQSLDLVEDGATVEVSLSSSASAPQRWLLLIEKNPNPLAARFDLSERVRPELTLRLKVAESCDLWALAMPLRGMPTSTRRHVEVTLGGCGEGEIATDLPRAPTAPAPTRIRIRRQGAGADVRMLMSHIMETGLRKDTAGRPVPAWHIQEVTVSQNDTPVLRARWGTSISRNPYLQFALNDAVAGDRIGVEWRDNRGLRRFDEATVT